MGTSWSSKAIIGVEVPRSALFVKRTVKAFEHNHPESMKFDPQTGKPLWSEAEGPKFDEFDGDKILSRWNVHVQSFCGEPTDFFYIALTDARTGSNRLSEFKSHQILNLGTLSMKFNDFKTDLETLHLWNESKFGLWSLTEAG
jgi:hypothetical protein